MRKAAAWGVGLEVMCKEGQRQRGSREVWPGTAWYQLRHGPLSPASTSRPWLNATAPGSHVLVLSSNCGAGLREDRSFPREAGDEKVLFFNPINSGLSIFLLNSACKLASPLWVYLFLVSASTNVAKSNQLMLSVFCHKLSSSNSTGSLDTFSAFQIIII